VAVPGHLYTNRGYWLYPIIVPDVDLCYNVLNRNGIDASKAATHLMPIEPTVGSKFSSPKNAKYLIANALYMPIHTSTSKKQIEKITKLTIELL
jgi:dTDP-4-amino-4,6-dideoxygalactose transaminase